MMKNIVVILFVCLFVFIGCSIAPRSATMCISERTGTWVKCPKGYNPGDVIGKSKKNINTKVEIKR